MPLKTTVWDLADYLETPEAVVGLLRAVLEENDSVLLTDALGEIARAKGMTVIAQRAGLSPENLHRSLSAEGSPELTTLFKIMDAMDLRLDVRAKQVDPEPA